MFKSERSIRFVVMVTPEDLKANAGKMKMNNSYLISSVSPENISRNYVITASGNGLVPSGTKPLPKAVMLSMYIVHNNWRKKNSECRNLLSVNKQIPTGWLGMQLL